MDGRDPNPFGRIYGHVSGALGAVGLVSIVDDIQRLPSFAGEIAGIWQRFVTPVGRALFGWLADLSPIALPSWTFDYLVIGLIFAVGILRVAFFDAARGDPDGPLTVGIYVAAALLAWPLLLLFFAVMLRSMHRSGELRGYTESTFILFSPLIYAALVIFGGYVAASLASS